MDLSWLLSRLGKWVSSWNAPEGAFRGPQISAEIPLGTLDRKTESMDSTIQVRRNIFTVNSSQGGLYDPDGMFMCYTLEPSCNPLPGKPLAMPEGTYELEMQWSTEFKMDTPHYVSRDAQGNIVDVAGGHSYVEIHPGNFENATKDDSLDCLLVGKTKDVDYVGQSRDAYFDIVIPKLTELFKEGRVFIQIVGSA